MAKLIARVGPDGIKIAPGTLAEAGVAPGDRVEIRVEAPLSADQIQGRAVGFTARKLGFGILVSPPGWRNGEWVVELRSRDRTEPLGLLFLDPYGTVIEEKSATYESIYGDLDAARALLPAA
jgi:hypothetical protein